MDRETIVRMAYSDPQFARVIDAIRTQLQDVEITPDELDEAIQMFELMLNQPEAYQEIKKAAVADGVLDPEDLPEQYDPVVIISFLVVFYGLQDQMRNTTKFAKGGLAKAAMAARSAGRYGDTQLVHMNSAELSDLSNRWGQPTINPHTGMPEFFLGKLWKGIKKVLKVAAPIVLSVVAPGLGTALGSALGLSGTAAAIAGGTLLGGGMAALTGGDPLKGALMGGLGSGLGGAVGGAANKALGLGLGETGQAMLGGGLLGGVAGQVTGQGFLKGAAQGVVGGAIGQLAGGVNAPNAFQQGVQAAGQSFGNALTAGYDPKMAGLAGLSAGLARGVTFKAPSDAVIDSLKTGNNMMGENFSNMPDGTVMNQGVLQQATQNIPGTPPSLDQISQIPNQPMGAMPNTASTMGAVPQPVQGAQTPQGGGFLGNAGKYLALAGAASSLMSAPEPVKEAVQQLSPQQQEYFNRPSISWDWNKLQQDAARNGMSLSQYMSNNWNSVASGAYNNPPTAMAHGGALSAVSRFARGAGSGRDDVIDAKLSDGEYVIDAETVALIGDGSSKEGARRLDDMRKSIRQHKGKALAKGKFSPNAKSPLNYLKGAA